MPPVSINFLFCDLRLAIFLSHEPLFISFLQCRRLVLLGSARSAGGCTRPGARSPDQTALTAATALVLLPRGWPSVQMAGRYEGNYRRALSP